MARASVNKNYFNFIGGKHSDGSALIPPENTARVLQNVELHTSGKISRRLGLDYENDFFLNTDTFTDDFLRTVDVSFYEWATVSGDGRRNFYLVRVGETIYIFNQSGIVTSNTLLISIDISSFSILPSESPREPIQVASGKGILFVTGELYEPFSITFDSVSDTFTTSQISIQIRDFIGVDDGLSPDERPAAVSSEPEDLHLYNLLNQGWGISRKSFENNNTDLDYKIFGSEESVFPSNSDIAFLGMSPDPNQNGELQFRPSIIKAEYSGQTLASKGHFLLNPFDKNRLEASGVFGLPVEGLNIRPRSTAFFSGRIWYGATKGDIFFSQILESVDKAGKCHQEQDPTSEEFNSLLDTDGGVIHIPEMGELYKMIEVQGALLLLANNGIWSISGGSENFTANTTQVSKVSDVGTLSGSSIVKVENTVLFWSDEGIFSTNIDQISGKLSVTSISDNRINRDFNTIPARSKVSSQGAYDRVDKKVFWSYHDGLRDTSDALQVKFNAVLVFDVTLNAFYDYRVEDNGTTNRSAFMAGMLKGSSRNEGEIAENVVVNDVLVTANGVNVTVNVTFSGSAVTPIKVLTFAYVQANDNYQITFSEFCSRSFRDWKSQDSVGADTQSIVETNPETLGEPSVAKQATYLTTFYDFKREGFGAVLTDPRIDASKGFRVSQNVIEILRKGTPKARVTQNVIEVLRSGTPKSRVTQNVIEVLRNVS